MKLSGIQIRRTDPHITPEGNARLKKTIEDFRNTMKDTFEKCQEIINRKDK